MHKMKFSKDMFYTDRDVPLYQKGKVYDVEDRMVVRWLKRGGEIVEDAPKVQEEVKTAPKEQVEPKEEKLEDKVVVATQSKPLRSGNRK